MLASDSSGSGNHGTIAGATWSSAGPFGNAPSFDGVNDWVTIADAASLDLTTGMTLEAYVYPHSLPSAAWRQLFVKERGAHMSYALYANSSTNRPSGHVYIGGDRSVRGTAQLPLNTWTHLATTFDGATQRLYVDGVQVASRAQPGSIAVGSGPLRIGELGLAGVARRPDRRGAGLQPPALGDRDPDRHCDSDRGLVNQVDSSNHSAPSGRGSPVRTATGFGNATGDPPAARATPTTRRPRA